MVYPIFVIPIIVGCATQFAKVLLHTKKSRKLDLKFLLISGHMPSAHSAFVVSITTIVAFLDGIYSIAFAISFVFSYIVIYDALKIRINIGHNGEVLNKLIQEIPNIKKENYPILRERVGHKPLEVLVGAILGFILTVLLMVLFEKL